MKNKQAWKIALASIGAFLFFSPSVGAALKTSNLEETSAEARPSDMPVQVAQAYCPDRSGGLPMVDFFETDNFWIYICQSEGLYYHGVEKPDGNNYITLPAYAEEGTGYVADNKGYSYIVNGAALSIYRDGYLIQKDAVHQHE
ncbi:MAG: hypothetical protein F6J93_32475 [Oscillatoria sp. SIO1A7]|nr:hypothetical protein [Oscillatoria sp. SIO1A7]